MFSRFAVTLAPRVKTATKAAPAAKAAASETNGRLTPVESSSVSRPLHSTDVAVTEPRVSRLQSGLTVVTREARDNVDHVGFFFPAGPVYEDATNAGSSVVLSHMFTKSSFTNSSFALVKAFQGNQSVPFTPIVGRQMLGFVAEGLPEDLPMLVQTFAEQIFTPLMRSDELLHTQNVIDEMNNELVVKAPRQVVLDGLFEAAFEGQLARPLTVPSYNIHGLSRANLAAFWQKNVNVGSGFFVGSTTWQHDYVCECLRNNADLALFASGSAATPAAGSWKGARSENFYWRRNFNTSADFASPLSFAAVGYPTGGFADSAGVAASAVLAASPRLAPFFTSAAYKPLEVVVENFASTGLFGAVAEAEGDASLDALRRFHAALVDVATNGLTAEELDTAKLAASIQAHGSRAGAVQRMALAALNGRADDPSALDAVTPAQVKAFAASLINAKPALSFHGDPPGLAGFEL